ncbi:uncharacterized protein DCS_03405 [Drechmeria coniospora]|uniref:Uncharacterized protein n=1 Tax=Drechmeria coniospora TaxID=98403 RepID=A0A151GH35_DRECN|nr:uncharacterized protein DCS_03405 [Drechmeria coniospora]KYK56405.1 uncharacterized protein DCS_03405 [Drechmeria coniospora]
MSRNVRQKYPSTLARPPNRRRGSDSSSCFDLSDDDGYSAVEEVSDSEDDDEEDVNAAEEENILTEATVGPAHAPRPQLVPVVDGDDDEDDDDDEEEVEEEDDEDDDDDGDDDDEDDDDQDGQHQLGDADESTSWAGIVSEVEAVSDLYPEPNAFASDVAVERHVRFDVPSSDSDSTDTEDDHGDLFPDIFVSQNSLDPSFRREIEHDPDESSGSGSFWDFNGQYDERQDSDAEEVIRELLDDETPRATSKVAQLDPTPFTPAFEENLELDGYESEHPLLFFVFAFVSFCLGCFGPAVAPAASCPIAYLVPPADGDTTEEDIPEPPVRRKTRRPSNHVSEDSDSDAESAAKPQRGQPRVGRFNLDRRDKKPIAVLNPLTRKMMIFTPHRRRQLDLSPEQFNFTWGLEEQSSPLLSSSANMMLSAMFSSNTFGDFVNAQTMGPAEAFFPFHSDANTADDDSAAPSVRGDEDEAEKKLDISDFITWDGESSADEGDGSWEPASTPVRPTAAPTTTTTTTTTTTEREVLSHLNSDTVGAFRRNQINQQLILSSQATQDSLAFSGPYNYTAIKGLKSDRFDTAGIPLTPMRRQKKQMSDVARSPLESASAKRKASTDAGAAGGHKKHRSISDVNLLRI